MSTAIATAVATGSHVSSQFRVVVAESDPAKRCRVQRALKRPNVTMAFAENGRELLQMLNDGTCEPALVILDLIEPLEAEMFALREIRRRHPNIPIIMLSDLSSIEGVVHAMNSQECEPWTNVVRDSGLHPGLDDLCATTASRKGAAVRTCLAPSSAAATGWRAELEPLLERISGFEVPILLQGETGSGKEVLARQIHERSPRSGRVFLKLNCAALPSELVESELFGYERGAFTGAYKSNPGKFEFASGGTIFLDEIGDMDVKLQAKLLQVLQDQEFVRIGAQEPTRVDVRVIAATHRDLEEQISQGAFREDLYYRLNVVNITIPPLRERRDELLPLAALFLRKHAMSDSAAPEITPQLKGALLDYHWPGNIRELENVMRRFVVMRDATAIVEELAEKIAARERDGQARANRSCDQIPAAPAAGDGRDALPNPNTPSMIAIADQQSPKQGHTNCRGSELAKLDDARASAQAEMIIDALNKTFWNRKRAAEMLGIDYKAFLYRLKRLGIGSGQPSEGFRGCRNFRNSNRHNNSGDPPRPLQSDAAPSPDAGRRLRQA